jgi:hypothetical protein
LVNAKDAPLPTRSESELINPVEYWLEELMYQLIDSLRTGLLQVHPEQFATLPTSEYSSLGIPVITGLLKTTGF